MKKEKRTCPKGHTFFKSSSCPTCPVCEEQKKPEQGFLSSLSAPARRGLENNGIKTLKQLARFSEAELLQLHGIGPSSIPKLKKELEKEGLSFKRSN